MMDIEKELEEYFQKQWPGMDTPEQCNTRLEFTPPAIKRLAEHFYNLGRNTDLCDRIFDAVNEYIGHPREVDEGITTMMCRSAFKAGAEWRKKKDFDLKKLSLTDDDLIKMINESI